MNFDDAPPPAPPLPAPSSIAALPSRDRPREKLARCGPEGLSDSELIAILLRTGLPGVNAIEMARRLLSRYGSLAALARAPVAELSGIKGIGPAKAIQLAAAFGLGSRLAAENFERLPFNEAGQVYRYLGPQMRLLERESFRVLLLDTRRRLIRMEEVSLGSINESIAHPREIFRPVLLYSAFAVVVAHNHPSGDPSPGKEDRRLTRRLAEAARILMIELFDHVIIGSPSQEYPSGYFSFREYGLL
ncbi:MAG TPA: DNA repair protein RadC [Chthoniobacteraceae bacterium]|nr:DNA repair protein RadC [Chthoniobacteraceae bacterium]